MALFGIISRNVGLKIVGLILALLLWFHVATNKDYDIELSYALDYVSLPESMVITAKPPAEIGVLLRASGKQLLRLWWSNRVWPVDLSRVDVGEEAIRMYSGDVPRFGIEDIDVLGLTQSEHLSLWIDSLETKTLPVFSDEIFLAAPGFIRSGAMVLTPDSIILSGPRALLAGIVTLPLEHIGRDSWDEAVDQTVAVSLPSAYNIDCDPCDVRVVQNIERFVTQEYDSLPIAVVPVGTGQDIKVDPGYVTVEVGGAESQMLSLHGDSIRVVYAASRTDTNGTRGALWVNVPSPCKVLRIRPDSITVRLDEHVRSDTGD